MSAGSSRWRRLSLRAGPRTGPVTSGAAEAPGLGQAQLAATSLDAALRLGHVDGAPPRILWGLTAAAPVALLVNPGRAESIQADAAGPVHRIVVVRPGDCLWTIAQHYLGAGDRYPALLRLNLGHDMGDGRVFTDPALILPGWQSGKAENAPSVGKACLSKKTSNNTILCRVSQVAQTMTTTSY